ncbi:MAG: trypsin-like serine protease [Marinilabiliaceae bacterium]|nr:trypsin-like serine protease [Marinilabiliaceae bacterium]
MNSKSLNEGKIKFLLFLFFILFCSQVFSVIIRHDKKIEKYTEYANQPKFNCVGYFSAENGNGGTFVLISPIHILTAAHSFIDYDTEEEIIEIDNKTVTVYNPYNERIDSIEKYIFNLNGKILNGKKLILHPNYFIDSEEDPDFDIAIIELEESVNDVVFPTLYDKFDEQEKIGTFVGFGASGFGNTIVTELLNLKIAGNNVIDSIGGALYLDNYCKLFADFDDPEKITPNKLGDSSPLELEFGTGGGDSGGPLFFESDNDQLFIVGILTGGGLTSENIEKFRMYGQINEWTRISTFKKWIENTINDLQSE